MSEPRDERPELPEELRALGRFMNGPDGVGETMAERVLAQIIAEQVPASTVGPPGPRERARRTVRWARQRWRLLTAALCGVAAVVVLTPQVRAAVYDWFGFGGIEIHYAPSTSPAPAPGAQDRRCGAPLAMDEAVVKAGFRPLVPAELGSPDSIAVTYAPGDRPVVSLCWRKDDRTVRLDEFPARLDIGFTTTVSDPPDQVSVGRESGLWFAQERRAGFQLLDGQGQRWHQAQPTAGPAMLWSHGAHLTLRLEGVASEGRALKIARSTDDRGGSL
ncbi:hypothetical protein ACFW9D_12840 [Streptomyces sp. NPDC059524]|uniref:hypothetical protein n=1 Tax=Streptomyces sp. NPDC059524 TaxID=3346856 RepID=UPI0036B6A601